MACWIIRYILLILFITKFSYFSSAVWRNRLISYFEIVLTEIHQVISKPIGNEFHWKLQLIILGFHFGWQTERGVGRVAVGPHHEHARKSWLRPSPKNDVGLDNVVVVVTNVARFSIAHDTQRSSSKVARRQPRSDSSWAYEQVYRIRQTGESIVSKGYS